MFINLCIDVNSTLDGRLRSFKREQNICKRVQGAPICFTYTIRLECNNLELTKSRRTKRSTLQICTTLSIYIRTGGTQTTMQESSKGRRVSNYLYHSYDIVQRLSQLDILECTAYIRPSLNNKLFPVHRLTGLKKGRLELFFSCLLKQTGNNFLPKGGLTPVN